MKGKNDFVLYQNKNLSEMSGEIKMFEKIISG